MMMLSEIAKTLHAPILGEDVRVSSVGTDSRSIVNGQLFVAIKGERFDGNSYAAAAIQQGAVAVLISDANIAARPAVLVEDTKIALGVLAQYWRQKFSLPVVAVTGSNGKTTVKEMIASILKVAKGDVLATKGNLNNEIGMPLTLLNLRANHSGAVIEMGMNHLGEIRYLTKLASPQIALVNNAGTAHMGEVGSREAIAEAKGEIFEGLVADGIAVINADDSFATYWCCLNQGKKILTFGLNHPADVTAEYVVLDMTTQIDLKTPEGHVSFEIKVLGEHNVRNVLAASTVAIALGLSNQQIAEGLSLFDGMKGRLQTHIGYQQAVVIDDTYNANPDSMKAAIDVLVAYQNKGFKNGIFVMGDMAELGADEGAMHQEIGAYARQKGVSAMLSFGPLSRLATSAFGDRGDHFDVLQALVDHLKAQMQAETCVLVKGSRSMKMERVVDAIVNHQNIRGVHECY